MAPTLSRPRLSPAAYLMETGLAVDRFISAQLNELYPPQGAGESLERAIRDALRAGGRRIRPVLACAAVELYRPLDEDALRLAAALELLHTSSLIFDDLPAMDNARTRRGQPALHVAYGEATAILAALALWGEAVRLVASIEHPQMRTILAALTESAGCRGLTRGQFLDLGGVPAPATLEELEERYYLKTGVLFKSAALCGALLADAPPAEQVALARFGEAFGLCYQLRDDLLDESGSVATAGKDVGADLRNGRVTSVTLLGLSGATARFCELRTELATHLTAVPHASDRFAGFIPLLDLP